MPEDVTQRDRSAPVVGSVCVRNKEMKGKSRVKHEGSVETSEGGPQSLWCCLS